MSMRLARLGRSLVLGRSLALRLGGHLAWSLLNKARQPTDKRFSDAVLVVLTVKERLRVLRPSPCV